MTLKLKQFAIVFALMFSGVCYGQDPAGPQPKRARVPEDYQPRTLQEIATKVSSPESLGNKQETMIVDPDLAPSRVRVKYAGLTRRIPELQREVINQWARLHAGATKTYRAYEVDVLFSEDGKRYWLTFKKDTLEQFWNDYRLHRPVDLLIIRMGAAKILERWEPVLLVENFELVDPK